MARHTVGFQICGFKSMWGEKVFNCRSWLQHMELTILMIYKEEAATCTGANCVEIVSNESVTTLGFLMASIKGLWITVTTLGFPMTNNKGLWINPLPLEKSLLQLALLEINLLIKG